MGISTDILRFIVDNTINVFSKLTANQPTLRDSNDGGLLDDHSLLKWVIPPVSVENKTYSHTKNTKIHRGYNKRVAIVLGYYNGNKFLPEQIKSIVNQSHEAIDIFISDDCSNKEVDFKALDLCAEKTERIRLGVRPSNLGFTNNFLNALGCIDKSFDYYAFSDQDDIWNEDKIANALAILENYHDDQPALYCARTAITNENCQEDLGKSPRFNLPPSFANSLVQNVGGGNTMVFNRAARDLIVKFSENVSVVSHDWWCYQVVSGAGGIVHYDPNPCLRYRQHTENLVGCNNNWQSRLVRIRALLKGRFRDWIDINLTALSKNKAHLTPANQKCLDEFIEARQSGLLKRLLLFRRTGIYRQTLFGNLGLILGILINKV